MPWRAEVVQTDRDADSDAARSRRFQQLALPHLDAAYNLARWLCGNPNDADDVVQEAFMRAFRFFDTFRGDSARPWLLAIVRRTWYTEWRRRASSHETVEFDDTMDDATFDGWSAGGADPQALLIRDEDTKRVHEALALLPVEYREVLILRELEEMGYREIAQVADVPIGTVMSRLARGRRKLAALLTDSGDGLAEAARDPASRGMAAKSSPQSGGAGAGLPGAATMPASGAAAGPRSSDDESGAAQACRCATPTASVTPLRAVANARSLTHRGGATAGNAQETPDGL
ncbi:RNA polymerase sigma factor [Paraburkholderia phenoliruptrix]|nr:RNA polymerase sigma factor [Paraburkholderia phenoliruptrix]WMY09862.1 RNA polymerase sigma factor [Paraburkholderia phenoliruptrix]